MSGDGAGPMYKVLSNEQVGRYGVATRTLEPGAAVLSELPFALGPKVDATLQCLGCYLPADGDCLCTRCGWPVCGAECEVRPAHRDFECPLFEAAGARLVPVADPEDTCPQFECILPLRVLITKERNPTRWQQEVSVMEHHNDKRRETQVWEANHVNTVVFLRDRCQLANRFDEELIHTVCGILEINCFEVRCANGQMVRALYPQTAIMSHSCVPNTAHTINTVSDEGLEEYKLTLRVTTQVPEGGELFTLYTHSLDPTMVRREMLLEGKYFSCTCERCKDPTELGTHLSSLKCNKCDNGLILSSDPLDPKAQWRCTHCEFCTRGDAVRRVLQIISSELSIVDAGDSIEDREQLFRKYRSVLHPQHAYLTQLRHSLSQLYGRAEGYFLHDLPDVVLERKVDLCRDLLRAADVVEPGLSRLRGVVLYELHAPLMILARHLLDYGEIDNKAMLVRMQEAADLLAEAVKILQLEDPSTSEGAIGRAAVGSLEQLRASLDELKAAEKQ